MSSKKNKKNLKKQPNDLAVKADNDAIGFQRLASASSGMNVLNFALWDAATLSEKTYAAYLNCDSSNADASALPEIRKRLREFARKEVANNSYAKGLTLIVSGDLIGSGPRAQVAEDSFGNSDLIENAFQDWAEEVKLAEKLRTACSAKMVDGESFGVFYRDKKLESSSKLNIGFIESECVCNPFAIGDLSEDVDGIFIDEAGEPTKYRILKEHPGSQFVKGFFEYVDVPADNVVHWYRVDRPGQHRGVSEFAPALPLFYLLRNYTLAVVKAAESAASIPLVLYTDNPSVEPYHPQKTDYFTGIKLRSGEMTVLPDAWRLSQVNPTQPTTTYAQFKRELLAEIARCFCVPVNVLSGDSSEHNYASGRLDFQTYHKAIEVERKHCEENILNKVFSHWFEQTFFRGTSPDYWGAKKIPRVKWLWDGFPHVDPVKEATATARQLASGTLTYAEVLARKGVDWKTHFEQLKRERDYLNSLGIEISYGK